MNGYYNCAYAYLLPIDIVYSCMLSAGWWQQNICMDYVQQFWQTVVVQGIHNYNAQCCTLWKFLL